MWEKIKSVFWKFMSGMICTLVATLMATPPHGAHGNGNGFGMNGFLCFAIWIGLMFVDIKLNSFLALGLSIVAYIGFGSKTGNLSSDMTVTIVVMVVGLAVLIMYSRWRDAVAARVTVAHGEGKQCCPKCGSTMIHFVQGHTNVYTEYNNGIVPEVKSQHEAGYWKCDNCGKEFNRG